LFISHDLGVNAEMADDVGVMYAGYIAEIGPAAEILDAPRHPYTRALLRAMPRRYKADGGLDTIPGSVPNLARLPPGCPFRPRCPIAQPVCADPPVPPLDPVDNLHPSGFHRAACLFPERVAAMG
jgi:oligopeptide/dipeptide ABC transporter ATP-binding protein